MLTKQSLSASRQFLRRAEIHLGSNSANNNHYEANFRKNKSAFSSAIPLLYFSMNRISLSLDRFFNLVSSFRDSERVSLRVDQINLHGIPFCVNFSLPLLCLVNLYLYLEVGIYFSRMLGF